MPNYHFRIKSSNRSAIKSVKASDHCDYINREGRFRDCDETSKEKLVQSKMYLNRTLMQILGFGIDVLLNPLP